MLATPTSLSGQPKLNHDMIDDSDDLDDVSLKLKFC